MEKVADGLFVSVDYKGTLQNGQIFDTSEGRQPLEIQMGTGQLIKGFEDPLVYATVLPHVCAFGVNTPININTATTEVLRSLADDLTDSDIEKIIEQRNDTAFNNINEFTSSSNLKDKIGSTEGLSVDTEYFMLQTESTIGQVRVLGYSIIHRSNDGNTTIIARSQGVY